MNIIKKIPHIILTYLQMGGILFDRFFLLRIPVIIFLTFAYFYYVPKFSQLVYYPILLGYATYFSYLFFVFSPKLKVSNFLVSKFGEEKAFLIHQLFLSLLFANLALSITSLSIIEKTGNNAPYFLPNLLEWETIIIKLQIAVAYVIIIIGKGIKVAAAFQLGSDGYYWKDLFLRKRTIKFQRTGIYKYFNHPMYGIGNISIYGISLLYGSLFIFTMGVIYQLILFAFLHFIEKPHMKEIYGIQST